MPARNPYVEFLVESMAPLGEITSRAMFGGHCLYCNGVVFGLVANNQLFLKADDENRASFERRGLQAFRPFEDRDEVMSYYQAPPEIFEDPEEVHRWCGGSVAAGMRAQAKKRTRNRAKRKGAL